MAEINNSSGDDSSFLGKSKNIVQKNLIDISTSSDDENTDLSTGLESSTNNESALASLKLQNLSLHLLDHHVEGSDQSIVFLDDDDSNVGDGIKVGQIEETAPEPEYCDDQKDNILENASSKMNLLVRSIATDESSMEKVNEVSTLQDNSPDIDAEHNQSVKVEVDINGEFQGLISPLAVLQNLIVSSNNIQLQPQETNDMVASVVADSSDVATSELLVNAPMEQKNAPLDSDQLKQKTRLCAIM
jgi:hypothetical protein